MGAPAQERACSSKPDLRPRRLTGTRKSRGCLAGLTLALPPAGRKGYGAYIEGRVLELGIKRHRKELAEEFQSAPGHWPGEARRIAATGAAEASLGAGL